MPDSLDRKFQGILREGWVAHVDDYALDCHWAAGGEVLIVGDASGTISGFDGKSGRSL